MPTVQSLKKKLRGIRTTQKISKAVKTASAIKFSRLNSAFGEYSKYCAQYKALYKKNESAYREYFKPVNPNAPVCYIIIASNKGMCGNFNLETLVFANSEINKTSPAPIIFVCGKKAIDFTERKKISTEKSFVFKDIPTYSDSSELFEEIFAYYYSGKISSVKIIYPKYINMMTQAPDVYNLFGEDADTSDKNQKTTYPDRETFINATAKRIIEAALFEKILECALGAQAATLLTMRSAYDNATEYSAQLESQIQRIRQSKVTADVIETSADRSQKEI